MKRFAIVVILLVMLCTSSWACNIPVFRYALERWSSDALELLMFHANPLSDLDQAQLRTIQQQARPEGGHVNFEVRLIDLSEELVEGDRDLWSSLVEADPSIALQGPNSVSIKPYAVLRGKHLRGPFIAWKGAVAEWSRAVVDSPARQELTRRLLSGHAVVWLVIKSTDEEKNQRVRQLLDGQFDQLEDAVELPEGIGLPGSELFSEVPLFIKYSYLEIERHDPHESFLLKLFAGFQPEAFSADLPLMVPVFGRGRGLEVIPADQLTEPLVRDLTQFLSAACSCQVKEQNPGFDLLMNVDWQTQLFGTDGPQPPPDTADGLRQQKPVLLPIPTGRK